MQENEQDILRRVRKIEIKTRGLSDEIFAGKYHTAFRGRGMSFSEVREYRAGDDVRDIDWNVTARSRKPHIKIYEEERARPTPRPPGARRIRCAWPSHRRRARSPPRRSG